MKCLLALIKRSVLKQHNYVDIKPVMENYTYKYTILIHFFRCTINIKYNIKII
jgi:hypothetical protein